MKVDARTATAKDFDKAAEKHAHAFWLWLIVAGVVWYFTGLWWPVLPGLMAVWCVVNSVGATIYAKKLREGTFPFPNPNNGKADAQ